MCKCGWGKASFQLITPLHSINKVKRRNNPWMQQEDHGWAAQGKVSLKPGIHLEKPSVALPSGRMWVCLRLGTAAFPCWASTQHKNPPGVAKGNGISVTCQLCKKQNPSQAASWLQRLSRVSQQQPQHPKINSPMFFVPQLDGCAPRAGIAFLEHLSLEVEARL